MRRRAVRVLVIDSKRAVAGELAGTLKRAGFDVAVGQAGTEASIGNVVKGVDALALGPSGAVGGRAALCSALWEGGYDGGIVAVCADASEGAILVEHGVDDFVMAPVQELELATRLRFCRKRGAARRLLRWGPLELDCLRRTVRLRGRTLRLTARDCEVLACFVEARGRVVTRARLREQVWEDRQGHGTNAVEVHLSRLRDKLGDDASLIETVRRVGYRLRPVGETSR